MKNVLEKVNSLVDNSYEFGTSRYLSRGWEIFKEEAVLMVAYAVISTAIIAAVTRIPMGGILVNGPLLAGYYLAAQKIDRGEKLVFSDFFKGFNYFVQLLLLAIVSGIIMVFGFLCLIIPGIYLAVAYMFGTPLILFGKMEFWDAMEASRKVITKNWFSIFGFIIISFFITLGGMLLLGVGIFVTIPWMMCAFYAAFADVFALDSDEYKDDIIDHLVTD